MAGPTGEDSAAASMAVVVPMVEAPWARAAAEMVRVEHLETAVVEMAVAEWGEEMAVVVTVMEEMAEAGLEAVTEEGSEAEEAEEAGGTVVAARVALAATVVAKAERAARAAGLAAVDTLGVRAEKVRVVVGTEAAEPVAAAVVGWAGVPVAAAVVGRAGGAGEESLEVGGQQVRQHPG